MYLSKFDLNIENGEIEDPIKPTIRVGMPLYAKDKDIQYGYLILNYDGKNLVSSIKDLFLDRQSDILIANSNFDWLVHPQPEIAWGFMYNFDYTLDKSFPEVAFAIDTQGIDNAAIIDGTYWTWQWIDPNKTTKQKIYSHENWLLLIKDTHQAYGAIASTVIEKAIYFFLSMFALISIAIGLWIRNTYQKNLSQDALFHEYQKSRDLKLKNQERKKSEQYWKGVIDALPQHAWLINSSGIVRYVNDKWEACKQLCSNSQHAVELWNQTIHPDDKARFNRRWAEVSASQISLDINVRLLTDNDHYQWFKISGTPKTNTINDDIEWIGTNTNIDTLVEVESKLNESNRAFSNMIKHNPIPFIEINTKSGFSYFNLLTDKYPGEIEAVLHDNKMLCITALNKFTINRTNIATHQIFSHSRKEECDSLLDIIPNIGNNHVDFCLIMHDVFTLREVRNIGFSYKLPDGSVKFVKISITPTMPNNDDTTYLISILDQTESKDLRERLKQSYANLEEQVIERTHELEDSKRFLETLTGNLPMPIAYIQQDQKIIYANPNFFKHFGKINEFSYNDLVNTLGHENALFLSRLIRTTLSGEICNEGIQCQEQDEETHYLFLMVPDFKSDSSIKGAFVVGNDITDLRNEQAHILTLNQELESRTREAEKASLAKSDFVANISHEIRTSMNGILGLINVLGDTPLDSEQQSMLSKITKSASALMSILNEVLDYSKLEANKLSLHEAPFLLEELLDEIADLHSVNCSKKGIHLMVHHETDVPQLLIGDALRIGQIFNNLIGNAVKFTDSGHIKIHCQLLETFEENVTIKFSIEDTGIGISDQAKDKIFLMFTQADESTTREYGGTGLGLAIAQKLVSLMSGSIGVDSESGKGSTFWFTLCLKQVAEQQQRRHSRFNTVIVCEPYHEQAKVIGYYLESWHAKTLITHNLEALSEQVKALSEEGALPDAVVIDSSLLTSSAAINQLQSDFDLWQPNLCPEIIYLIDPMLKNRAWQTALPKGTLIQRPITSSKLFDVFARDLSINSEKTVVPDIREKAAPLHGLRALLVEDNDVNQDVATALLAKLGIQCEIANDGVEAVSQFKASLYDLILMDIQMPRMDGFTATQRIRALTGGEQVTIIAMTAAVFDHEKERIFSTGMNGHIPKPLDVNVMVSVLLETIPKHLLRDKQARAEHTKTLLKPHDKVHTDIILQPAKGFDFEDALNKISRDPKVFLSITQTFIGRMIKFKDELIALQQHQDNARIAAIVHTIKGSSLNVGAVDLYDACLSLEEDIRASADSIQDGSLSSFIDSITTTLVVLNDKMEQIQQSKAKNTNTCTTLINESSHELLVLLDQMEGYLSKTEVVPDALIESLTHIELPTPLDHLRSELIGSIAEFSYETALPFVNHIREALAEWKKTA